MSKLFDTSITSIGDSLMKSLHWINTNYGRTERRKTEKLERNKTTSYYYPAKYTGNGEYINTLPNDTSKNSVFFSVEDAQEFVSTNAYAVLKGRVNAIFWVDLRTIFPNVELSNTEEIKDEIIFAFSKCPNVELLNIYEQPDNVFNKYTIKDVPVQFLMYDANESPEAKSQGETDTQEDVESPMPVNYELVAFEWVEDHISYLSDQCNEAIARGDDRFVIP